MKQGNAMQRASQQILSTNGSKRQSEASRGEAVQEPVYPPLTLGAQEASEMSHTNCLSFASSSGGYPRGTLRGMLHSLLCRSGSGHSPSASSRSLPQSVPRADDLRADTSGLSASCLLYTSDAADE